MKYSIVTFGCRVNQADSLRLEEELLARGAEPAHGSSPDLVIVNTCSVTANADQSARQAIRRLARDHPSVKVIVTGCYASREPQEVGRLPNVLKVIPNAHKEQLIDQIAAESGFDTATRFGKGDGPCGAVVQPGVAGRTAYTLRVQTGCSERCSYCIIPTTRGPNRSVPVDAVLAEVRRVAGCGFKEVALTGVHLGSYGRDLIPPRSLLDLLRALMEEPSGVLYRISSLEPMDCSPEIVSLVAISDRFAPHFHLPLQHADPGMLQAMRRPYTPNGYARLVDRIREQLPDAAIGSDIIAGFPGEDDRAFHRLVDYLEHSPLTHVHVFPYSERPGTEASKMAGRVEGATVRQRASQLRQVGHELTRRFRESQLTQVRHGLTLDDGTLVVTDNYLKVRIAPGLLRNRWVRVRIDSVSDGDICGSVVD